MSDEPAVLRSLLDELRARGTSPVVRMPRVPDGTWWVDVRRDGRLVTVEWRPGLGFGVSAASGAYGEGPDELLAYPEEAARRAVDLLLEKPRPLPSWVAAADAMHAELFAQLEALMEAKPEAGTPEGAQLGKLAAIVEGYETLRWPLDGEDAADE